ncbi:HAD family hydrolase [Saccharopolyspora griseoalba]|uniref:HAD family hydrolase n=1 Tax=Saccharopolyspora griseoalba TaxID=1431848 RepID=A0ABW2LF71_9PSEU
MTFAPDASRNPAPAGIKAVCLDLDETLLDGERASRTALRELLGTDRAWPVWQRVTDQHYARYLTGEVGFDTMCVERTQAFFAAFGETLGGAEAARREARRMAAMQRAWRLFDDVRPCLDWLAASGLKLAVVTNAPGDYQRAKLGALGLAADFDAVVVSGDIGIAKPDPRIFRAACERLDLPPGEVVHVGDRLGADAQGAARAGLHGVWLNRNGEPGENADVPTITGLDELPELLVADLVLGTACGPDHLLAAR